jgi:membrane protease YdiL (CAAX protease family)
MSGRVVDRHDGHPRLAYGLGAGLALAAIVVAALHLLAAWAVVVVFVAVVGLAVCLDRARRT